MKITFSNFLSYLSLLSIFMFGGCVSTISEEPSQSDDVAGNEGIAGDDEIVISVTGDVISAMGKTRDGEDKIHAGHQLRYTAKLYTTYLNKVNILTDGSNLQQTIEQLATDGNRIIFKNVADGDYFVTIFADYIDVDVSKDDKGHYPDKYYATPGGNEAVSIKYTESGNSQRFNNHNLDCFVLVSEKFTKESNIGYELSQPLTRAVTRVQVVSTGGERDALKNVTVENLKLTDKFEYVVKKGSSNTSPIPSQTVEVADREQGLLFFYYTFASGTVENSLTAEGAFSFTLNPKEGYEFKKSKWDVVSGIYYIPNVTYKIKGNLLLTSKSPANVAKLNVSVEKDWQEDEKNLAQ